MSVGKAICDFRRGLGITQTQMAEVLGIDRAHLSRIEHGQRSISFDAELRFAQVRNAARLAAFEQ